MSIKRSRDDTLDIPVKHKTFKRAKVDNGPNIFENTDEDVDKSEEDDNVFEQQPPKSIKQEKKELGSPESRSSCFGCVMIGERDKTAIPFEEFNQIIEMQRKSVAKVDMITLAIAMARKYKKLRNRINGNLLEGEMPLPPWKASTILEHIRFHNQDPELQQVIVLSEIQEARKVAFHALMEKNKRTGKKRVNKDQAAVYERMVKLQFFVQSKDATKMAFYSSGAFVEPKTLNEGAFASQGKKLVSFWK